MLKEQSGHLQPDEQAGDAQMAQNPMQAVMSEMMGMGQMSDNDIASAMEMFDMSSFGATSASATATTGQPAGSSGLQREPIHEPYGES